MLEVQKYLMGFGTLDSLNYELGIVATHHPTLPLVILNYSQIDSPKTNRIVRECRGLVLEKDTWTLVSRGFFRFFNWGEVQEEMELFDFSNFSCYTKEDGSYVSIYYYADEWRINTRGSFAQDNINMAPITWESAILRSMGLKSRSELNSILDPELVYIGEFCSLYNKVVRKYESPCFYLLTAFRGLNELNYKECDLLANQHMVRPVRHDFTSIEEIQAYLENQMRDDPTFEGVVICDSNHMRYKIKNAAYVALHQMRGNNNVWNPKYLLPIILNGETDELLTYFENEVKDTLEFYEEQVKRFKEQLLELWNANKHETIQKEFAIKIKDHPLSGILFTARKTNTNPLKVFNESEELILKNLVRF